MYPLPTCLFKMLRFSNLSGFRVLVKSHKSCGTVLVNLLSSTSSQYNRCSGTVCVNAGAFCWQLRKLRDVKSFRSACAVVPKTIITSNNKYSINSLSSVVHNTFSLTSLFNKSGPFYDTYVDCSLV